MAAEPVINPVTGEPFTYTLADFNTTVPFDYVLDIKDEFQQNVAIRALERHAVQSGMKAGFLRALTAQKKSRKNALRTAAVETEPDIVSFPDMDFDLETGKGWKADVNGIYRLGMMGGVEYACSHPIYPAERLKNIDTGQLKVKLKWSRGDMSRKGYWNEVIVPYATIANAKDIVRLADVGIGVTSSKAKLLVDYLSDVLDANYDRIPERKSVSQLGWNEEGFAPYIGNAIFDGEDSFGRAYHAISKARGSYEKWKAEARAVRAYSLLARITLAAAFASVLVAPMGCLPFFLHLWSSNSGTGKTVAQMVAASVWGEPTVGGDYFVTFNSSKVGCEAMAGFCRSLPVIIDELQLAKNKRSNKIEFNVYELAAGAGKLRSNTRLGLAPTLRWANCFITAGETPITSDQDGAGALNRVIEVECTPENKVIEDGHRTAAIMKANYGHAGREFIEILTADGIMDWVKTRYEALFKECSAGHATEKQSHSAALIVLADELATKWIFQDDNAITVAQLAEFLRSKESVSVMQRGYDYICDWVAQNRARFNVIDNNGDIYGKFPLSVDELDKDKGCVYIIRSAFNKACEDEGINHKALLSSLRAQGLIKTKNKGFTKAKRIGDSIPDCVVLMLKNSVEDD